MTAHFQPANGNELRRAMQRAIAERPLTADAAHITPAAAPGWTDFGRVLPRGTHAMLVKVAVQELNHLVLVCASCLEAGDAATVSECRGSLRKLARPAFQADELMRLAADDSSFLTTVMLLDAVSA
ncbi:MAG: hypothetical protein U1E15_13690 [Hyphomicrobiales bacterium]